MDDDFVNTISNAVRQIHALLQQKLIPLESHVNRIISNGIDDVAQIEKVLDDLLDCSQIEEGLAVFKRLCRYCYPIYPELTASYIQLYRELYDSNEEDESEK